MILKMKMKKKQNHLSPRVNAEVPDGRDLGRRPAVLVVPVRAENSEFRSFKRILQKFRCNDLRKRKNRAIYQEF